MSGKGDDEAKMKKIPASHKSFEHMTSCLCACVRRAEDGPNSDTHGDVSTTSPTAAADDVVVYFMASGEREEPAVYLNPPLIVQSVASLCICFPFLT